MIESKRLQQLPRLRYDNSAYVTIMFTHIGHQVIEYKCLGVIVIPIRKSSEYIFANNYPYLCDQGMNALFGVLHRMRSNILIPPKVIVELLITL